MGQRWVSGWRNFKLKSDTFFNVQSDSIRERLFVWLWIFQICNDLEQEIISSSLSTRLLELEKGVTMTPKRCSLVALMFRCNILIRVFTLLLAFLLFSWNVCSLSQCTFFSSSAGKFYLTPQVCLVRFLVPIPTHTAQLMCVLLTTLMSFNNWNTRNWNPLPENSLTIGKEILSCFYENVGTVMMSSFIVMC